ncbi:16S rRNA (uracil(1498)-N(3))-methyltransferase [Corynebacterium cystitidis]|uniref:Ribosomal RNA small subunit methyltransferase E n=1 Tax=Corynebacterium cystitidis DSM 20524 TaxID=1121357 RepID=A0A1H9W664_9CORY|nr:16S rRNA (uracil(1498)-N(3))-methyltransferase [Corynebacterium cystitidis]WJY83224.1 Ribosomal RNA small subunit methyltransferase E [Corynebacterium cystitidis DSM 20524]SES29378.1 16S rRNA (uracil1498-N3)-methyltransferase [Corynebacterium cystitidis DSM 20524]SNV67786.1 16S ribosomal RNA methyltransferase RsmE [Corynebacterium cystitidis]
MSLPYFFTDAPGSGQLAGPEGKHAVTVKRITPGQQIILTDGHGAWARVEVTATTGTDMLTGTVVEQGETEPPSPRVTVVQAIPKSERAELAVDLATQAGADAIIPWISHRTIARWQGAKVDKNVEKWRNTARQAAKQSRRTYVPEIHTPMTTNQLKEVLVDKRAYVLHEDATTSIRDIADDFATVDEIYLVVGPEGGIGDDELELLGATPVKLGPEVLRTATAAAIGLAAIGVLSGRWN